jgi:hypothetical protein
MDKVLWPSPIQRSETTCIRNSTIQMDLKSGSSLLFLTYYVGIQNIGGFTKELKCMKRSTLKDIFKKIKNCSDDKNDNYGSRSSASNMV